MTESGSSLKPGWVLLILTALHAGLVFFRLDEHGLWLDEVMSIEAALASWPELWRFFQTLPEQHPLYYLILRPWLFTFGDSPVALRSLTAAFSVATVPALYLFLRQFTDAVPALVATALFALAPFSVFYGQEGRMYSLLLFLVCVSSALWLKVLGPRPPRWAVWGYVAAAVAGVYTHFFFAFVVLAHGVLGAAWPKWSDWRSRLRTLILPTLVGVLYIPWMILILLNFPEGQGWKGTAHAVFSVPYTLLRFAVGYSIVIPNHDWQARIVELVVEDAILLLTAFVAFGILTVLGFRAIRRSQPPEEGRTLGFLGLVPVMVPLLLTPIMILAGERYFLVSYPLFLALLGRGLSTGFGQPSRWLRPLALASFAAVLVVWTFGHVRYFSGEGFGKEGWREAIELVAAVEPDVDELFYFPAHVGPSVRYHLQQEGLDPATTPLRDCGPISSARAWVILSHREDPSSLLACLANLDDSPDIHFFPYGVGIYLIRISPSHLDPALVDRARSQVGLNGTSLSPSHVGFIRWITSADQPQEVRVSDVSNP